MSASCLIVVTCSEMAFCASEMVFCTATIAKIEWKGSQCNETDLRCALGIECARDKIDCVVLPVEFQVNH